MHCSTMALNVIILFIILLAAPWGLEGRPVEAAVARRGEPRVDKWTFLSHGDFVGVAGSAIIITCVNVFNQRLSK